MVTVAVITYTFSQQLATMNDMESFEIYINNIQYKNNDLLTLNWENFTLGENNKPLTILNIKSDYNPTVMIIIGTLPFNTTMSWSKNNTQLELITTSRFGHLVNVRYADAPLIFKVGPNASLDSFNSTLTVIAYMP